MKSLQRGAALCLCLLVFETDEAKAHGPDSHGQDHHHHMEVMLRHKERIPEEYRVMDRTPMTPNGSSLGRGEELFAAHCAACHGAQGEGDGPAAAALETPPTSFLDLEHSDVFGPGEKYWIIKEGFPEAGMPGFEDRVGPADRWHLVNYIYHMQRRVRGGSGTHRQSDDRGHRRDGQLTDRHREFHPAAPQGGVPIPSE